MLTKNEQGTFSPQSSSTLRQLPEEFYKYADDPTVYQGSQGFSTPDQFFAAGGARDFSNVKTIPRPTQTPGSNPITIPTQKPTLPQGQPTQDPITSFNTQLLDMLKQAQGTAGNESLYQQQRALQRKVIDRTSQATPEELRNLSPSQQAAIRSGSSQALQPEIDSISSAIKARDSRLANFENFINTAKDLGGEIMKNIAPSKEIVEGYKNFLKAGGDITDIPVEVRSKIIGGLNAEDWQTIETKKLKAKSGTDLNELLSPTEAATLGLPYGTTRGQAAAKGITPKSNFLDDPRKQSAFNSIVDKYNKSPLIAASDRTIVLKNTVDAVRAKPSDPTMQLNLAYGYIQALDTYQSAVREGELGNLNSIDSKIGAFQNTIDQITNGQTVRPEIALQIANAANNLIDYINEGAKKTEQKFASQAQVNDIADEWNKFRGGFETNYDVQPTKLTPLYGPFSPGTPPLIKKYPYKEVQDYLSQYPNATENDIQQGLKELGATGFNGVGGDTNQATSKQLMSIGKAQPSQIAFATAVKYPVGSKGGQCTTFLHKIADFPAIGDGKTQKYASVDKYGIPANQWRNDIKIGDIIVTGENPTYGHTAMVNAVLPDGSIQLTESNYHLNEKVTYNRTISPNSKQIYGAIRPKLKPQLA